MLELRSLTLSNNYLREHGKGGSEVRFAASLVKFTGKGNCGGAPDHAAVSANSNSECQHQPLAKTRSSSHLFPSHCAATTRSKTTT